MVSVGIPVRSERRETTLSELHGFPFARSTRLRKLFPPPCVDCTLKQRAEDRQDPHPLPREAGPLPYPIQELDQTVNGGAEKEAELPETRRERTVTLLVLGLEEELLEPSRLSQGAEQRRETSNNEALSWEL